MSADSFVAYFGLRFELRSDEVETFEPRSDARVLAARKAGLDHYWGNFGGVDAKHLLFIGYELGVFGIENGIEARFGDDDIRAIMEQTRTALNAAGLDGIPALHLAYEPDV